MYRQSDWPGGIYTHLDKRDGFWGVSAMTAGVCCGVRCRTGIYCSDLSARSNCGLVLSQGQSYANVIPHRSNKNTAWGTDIFDQQKEELCFFTWKNPREALRLFLILAAVKASLYIYTPCPYAFLKHNMTLAFLKTCPRYCSDTIYRGNTLGWTRYNQKEDSIKMRRGGKITWVEHAKTARHPAQSILNQ